MAATTPTRKAMKMAAPVGSKAHYTHTGRLVGPGFLSRSVERVSKIKNGVAEVLIGVKEEAYYGVQFVERGTRFMAAQPWFKRTFERHKREMEQRFSDELRKRIKKAARA
jgi:HK97 gp10 family phage protein